MSRKFLGGSGKKGNNKKTGKMDLGKLLRSGGISREDMIRDKSSHSIKSHEEMLEDLIDEKMLNPGNKPGFHLPGTKPQEEREMSKGMKAALELAQQQKMKKKKGKFGKKGMQIKPQSFGMGADGGRITAEGVIMSNDGKILFRVDKETGKISDNMGKIVGKYKAGSIVNDTKIENLIKNATKTSGVFNPFAPKE